MKRREFLKGSLLGTVGLAATGLQASSTSTLGPQLSTLNSQHLTFDVCIVGGSCTGVFAAVRAAEAGLKVALVEKNMYFGGTATAGFVPVWHSLYSFDGKERIVGGLTQLCIDRLLARKAAVCNEQGSEASESSFCTFNAAALVLELDRLVRENPGIRPFLGAHFAAVETDRPGHVTRIFIEDKSGRRAIGAKFFIDCSGDADLVARAGFETWTLPKCDLQAHTLCALVSGADVLRKAHPKFSFSEMMHPRRGAKLDHVFQWEAPVIGCPSLTFLAATRVGGCDPSDADDLTRGTFEARAQLQRIVDAANREFPVDGPGLAIAAIAPEMGLRESRHVKCLYHVTGDDVLSGREYPDVIARGTYRVDIHEGKGIIFRYLDGREYEMTQNPADGSIRHRHGRWRPVGGKTPKCYQVPYRAIVPKGSVNVLCAGRMLDCARDAYGALRVMVNCNQMGEAAGRAAARVLKEGLPIEKACPAIAL